MSDDERKGDSGSARRSRSSGGRSQQVVIEVCTVFDCAPSELGEAADPRAPRRVRRACMALGLLAGPAAGLSPSGMARLIGFRPEAAFVRLALDAVTLLAAAKVEADPAGPAREFRRRLERCCRRLKVDYRDAKTGLLRSAPPPEPGPGREDDAKPAVDCGPKVPWPVNDYIVRRIREERIARRLRMRDVARRSGLPLGSYSCLETGRYKINLDNLFRILNVIGVPIESLWPGSVEGPVEATDDGFVARAVRQAEARRPPRATLADVIGCVCAATGTTPEELRGPTRQRKYSEARVVAALLVKKVPHLKLVDLSREFQRDVSGLSHSLRRAERRMPEDREFADKVRRAEVRLARMPNGLSRDQTE